MNFHGFPVGSSSKRGIRCSLLWCNKRLLKKIVVVVVVFKTIECEDAEKGTASLFTRVKFRKDLARMK